MKHSRFLLTGTTLLLAVAGIAATKAHKKTTNYYVQNGALCQQISSACTSPGLTKCTTSSGGRTVFTQSNGSTCSSTLLYSGE